MVNFYQWEEPDLILWIHVQPRARQNSIVGVFDNRLKIKITATPVDGQANTQISQVFAEWFGVPKSHVVILSGHNSRDKRLRIQSPKKLPHFMTVTQ